MINIIMIIIMIMIIMIMIYFTNNTERFQIL